MLQGTPSPALPAKRTRPFGIPHFEQEEKGGKYPHGGESRYPRFPNAPLRQAGTSAQLQKEPQVRLFFG